MPWIKVNKKASSGFRIKDDSSARLLFADDLGRVYDHPYLEMAGFDGFQEVVPSRRDLIPLPSSSKLFYLPHCPPVGFDGKAGRFVALAHTRIQGKLEACHAVAAFMEPGYVRTLLPSARYDQKDYVLPMWAYTAVGFVNGGHAVCGFQVENNPAWSPKNYDDRRLPGAIEKALRCYGHNPLVHHLARCAVDNHCFAAKNLFWVRWEAPLPVSRSCNASCLGCLSRQPKDSCPASHQRIRFRPRVSDIVDIAVHHLEFAEGAIVSFGQGCEGEPLTEADLIAESIREIRKYTTKGVINLNTNGSLTTKVMHLIDAGLDSIRISLNSTRPELYRAYYRPRGYGFGDVVHTIARCVERNLYTMLNYLIFPGVTDQEDELEAVFSLIRQTGLHFIHFKNLNIDPDLYLKAMHNRGGSRPVGIKEVIRLLKSSFPGLEIGYFNRPGPEVSNRISR
jgi:pyruvate-formate lyase-activating enzyme